MKGESDTDSDSDSVDNDDDQADTYLCDQPNATTYDDARDNPFRIHHRANQDIV